jgi:hypothetical protein
LVDLAGFQTTSDRLVADLLPVTPTCKLSESMKNLGRCAETKGTFDMCLALRRLHGGTYADRVAEHSVGGAACSPSPILGRRGDQLVKDALTRADVRGT